MPRFTTTTLIALVLLLAAPAAYAKNPVLGIADQKADTFTSARFKSLHVKRTRYVVPWNVALVKAERAKFESWYRAARRAHIREVLVAFNASAGSRCPAKPCTLPSVRSYTRAFRAFHRRYKHIRTIQPWNEANSPTQPTGPWRRGARAAARYYNVVRRYCKRCTITAADVLDLSKRTMARWVRQFKRYAKGKPRLWGLHNYTDTNRFRSTGTKTMLKLVKGQLWLTETGGIVAFTTAGGKVALKHDEKRARRAIDYLFRLARTSRRITRVYVYQWRKTQPGDRFDAGLVAPDDTARASLYALRRQLGLPPANLAPPAG
jgi:hypothetical protein